MKIKKIKRTISLVLAFCVLLSSFNFVISVFANGSASSGSKVSYAFSDLENLDSFKSDFGAYKIASTATSAVMTSGDIKDIWTVDTAKKLARNSNAEGSDFSDLSVLTYNKGIYENFEATITFQQSNKRYGIMFGTKDGEFAYTGTKAADVVPNGGVLVYAEAGGVVVAAGEAVSGNSSRPYYYRDGNATLSSFTDGGTQANIIAKKMHTLSIKVCDGILTVILDGIETSKTSITLTDNYKGGYVSLVSNGKKASGCFESFSIKPIAEVNEGGNADYAFSDLENLDSFKSDFDAYKIASTATSAVMTSGNIEDIWTIDTAKKLARNSNKEGSDFSDLSVLTYNKDTYENFEATITFQQSYKRYGIMFGTKDGEFAYTGTKTGDVAPNGGVLVFAEAEGVVVAAGEAVSGKSSRPYYYRDGNAKFSSFTDGGTSANIAAKKMHTLSIKVCDGILTVILDGLEETKTDITLTENYKGGYVSLVSNGKKTSGCFESFSIKPIAEVNEGGNADDESFDGYKFSNLKNLDSFKSDFDAYKIASTATSAVMTSGNIEDIWTVDTAKKLARNSNTEGTDFSDLSVLTYNKDTYENFEATITFQQSNKRYGIMFGTKDGEFAYTGTKAADVVPNGGVLVFAEAAGVVVAAGEVISGNSSRPYYYRDGNATLSSFTDGGTSANIAAKKMHTLSIKVCDGILTVILDGLEETKTDITLTDNYKGGYVSLVSNGKKASGCFESFSVKSVTAEEDTTDYSNIDFENISSVKKLAKDFETYYIEDASVSADAVKQEIVDAWIINNGKKLVRNTKTEGNDTKNLTMLTYTNKAFTDFELVTTYTQTYNRLGVIFGTDKGEFVIDDTSTERKANGVMVYIEAEGTRTAIGSLDGGYTNSAKKIRRITSPTLTGFKDENGKSSIGTVHTLKIVVKGKQAFIFVDDMENYCMYFTLPETYNGGYISLFSTASSSYGFGKFSVSETIKTDITTGGYTSDGTTISFNFDDIAMSTEYFDAYYLDGVESGLSKVKFSDYWEISDGKLYRKSKTTASSDVSDLAVITYNQQTYKDFKATVKYQKCGGRLMLMFGTDGKSYPITDSKAKTANNKGLAVYLENNFGTGGSLVSLGALPATTSSARTRTTDIMVEGYSKKGEWNYNRGTWHTLQIWVCNSKCYIFLDEYGLLTSYDLPEDYNGGYISLVSSQCAGLGFDDFTITDISNTEKNEIVDFDKVRDIKVKLGTVQSQIGLPKTMTVTSLNGKKHTVEVEWFCENYSPDKKGYYEFIGDIMPSDSITNPGYFKCKIGVSVIDYDTSVVKKWEFDSADDLLDFEAFTIKNITESPDSVWCNKYDSWSIKDGLLQHKSATEGSNTKNLSILTYTGEKYKNFEVNVSYKQYYTRCMVLFGSEDAGQYIFDDVNFKTNNAVATYVEFESKRVAMGNVEYPDKGYTITEEYPAISDYVQINENGKKKYGVFHNMRIVVQGNIGEIYVDDAETPLKIYLPEDRKEGYISLVTTGKNDAFDYLSIERLPEAKNQQVANNKIMANGYLDVKNVDRLEATQKPNSIDKNDVTPVETQPSKVNLFNILIFALGGLSVIFMITVFAYTIYKKRKQK